MEEQKEQVEKEQLFTLSFTKEEILERIRVLNSSENMALFLKIQKGQEEAEEMQKLLEMIKPYLEK